MASHLGRIVALVLALNLAGPGALAQSECEQRIDACEDTCPQIPDPNSVGNEMTMIDDPACVAGCAALCSAAWVPTCVSRGNCEYECGVVIDPATVGTNWVTVMKDPECIAACDRTC
jgi:hypothetical protein